MVGSEPDRFFKPATSAKGTFAAWLGVFLDTAGDDRVDWDEIAQLLDDAYRTVAPRTLTGRLDANRDPNRRQTGRGTAGVHQFRSELWVHAGEAAGTS